MVQHSFWHQRVVFHRSEPVCGICHNPVQFFMGDDVIGWRCHLGHPVLNPVYETLQTLQCPFTPLHNPTNL